MINPFKNFTRRGVSAALLAVALLTGGCATIDPIAAPPERIAMLRSRLSDSQGPVIVVAHRGCWKETAENSLSAIALCRRLGVDMVELDVRRTRDGALVLMHDETVDRTTNGTGAVADLTLAQVQALRLREGAGGAGTSFTADHVPTFEQGLEAARGGVLVNVDAKADVFDQVEAILKRLNMMDHVLIKTSAKPEDRAALSARLFSSALFMPIVAQQRGFGPISQVVGDYKPLRPVAYEIVFQDENYLAEGVSAMRGASTRIWVNTLQPVHAAGHVDPDAVADPQAHWGRLIGLGASIIQTDEPAALLRFLQSQKRSH